MVPNLVSPGHYPSHAADKLCPSCHCQEETPEHLIQCDSPNQWKIRQQFYHKFSQLCTTNNIDPPLITNVVVWYEIY